MPSKHDPVATPSQKVLALYCLLLFEGRKHSLTRLAEAMQCSKQTVSRMVEQIAAAGRLSIDSWQEDRQRWFRARAARPGTLPLLSPEELEQLVLCRDMVCHLLPQGLKGRIQAALAHTAAFLPDPSRRDEALAPVAGVLVKGGIDYTPHQEHLETLLQAIRDGLLCRIAYHAPGNPEPRTHLFAPCRLKAFHEALYAKGYLLPASGDAGQARRVILPVHRMRGVEALDERHGFQDKGREEPEDCFGVMEGRPFRVTVRFSPEVAAYVLERRWSGDQEARRLKNGSLILGFTARSEPEVVSWVLGFGATAKVLRPRSLGEAVKEQLRAALARYGG